MLAAAMSATAVVTRFTCVMVYLQPLWFDAGCRPGRSSHTPIGRNTTTTAVARWPSHVTVTIIEPLIRAVTSPVLDTLPTAGSLLAQLIARPRTALPEASHIAAVSCTVPRTTTWTDSGTIVTAAIGGGGAVASPHAATSRTTVANLVTVRSRAAQSFTAPPNSRGC